MFLVKLIKFVHINTSGCHRLVLDRDLIDTHGRKALHHVGHIAVDDTDQNDHRRDTNDDSKHREKGSHFVAPDTF